MSTQKYNKLIVKISLHLEKQNYKHMHIPVDICKDVKHFIVGLKKMKEYPLLQNKVVICVLDNDQSWLNISHPLLNKNKN